jgi:hypothetical protein
MLLGTQSISDPVSWVTNWYDNDFYQQMHFFERNDPNIRLAIRI